MSDITFEFRAKTIKDSKRVTIGWEVKMEPLSSLCFFEPDEWEAFKSLLMPSSKADFSILEFDEKGNKL